MHNAAATRTKSKKRDMMISISIPAPAWRLAFAWRLANAKRQARSGLGRFGRGAFADDQGVGKIGIRRPHRGDGVAPIARRRVFDLDDERAGIFMDELFAGGRSHEQPQLGVLSFEA